MLRKVQETDTNFRNFGRYLADQLKPVKTSFFASSMFKYIVLAMVIGLIVFILFLFLMPTLMGGGIQIP